MIKKIILIMQQMCRISVYPYTRDTINLLKYDNEKGLTVNSVAALSRRVLKKPLLILDSLNVILSF